MKYLVINPNKPYQRMQYADFLRVCRPFFVLYSTIEEGSSIKGIMRMRVLQYYQRQSGIIGFKTRSGRDLTHTTSWKIASSEACRKIFLYQSQKAAKKISLSTEQRKKLWVKLNMETKFDSTMVLATTTETESIDVDIATEKESMVATIEDTLASTTIATEGMVHANTTETESVDIDIDIDIATEKESMVATTTEKESVDIDIPTEKESIVATIEDALSSTTIATEGTTLTGKAQISSRVTRSTKRKAKQQRKAIIVKYFTRSAKRKKDEAERDTLENRRQPLVRIRVPFYHQSRKLTPSPIYNNFVKQCRQFLVRMIREPLGSLEGFPVVLEMPSGNNPMVNIHRHAPIRILFGLEKSIHGNYALRYAYGSGSGTGTVGPDPRTFQVRLMEDELREAAILIKDILRHKMFPDMRIFDFNSVEMKIYMGKAIKAAGGANLKAFQNDKLGFHCDQIYSKKGEFLVHMNSQEQWTPVVIASFGATRKLTFKLVDVNDKKKNKTAIANFVVEMKDGDVFLLCPADEYPTKYITRSICKWTHGVDALEKDDDFSVAMMFRVATNTVQVNRSSNKKILTTDDKESLESVINTTQKAGWKKRSTHFDQNDQQLTKFMMYEACKVHEKIQECSAKIIQKLES